MKWTDMPERQRDALVGTEVMGWTPRPTKGQEPWEAYLWEDPDGETPLRDDPDGLPHFSTSMDAAWLVVQRMNESMKEYADFIEELEKSVGSNMFFDLFYCGGYGDHLTPGRLCMAALRAVGVEVEA